ncbi:MAG TPA: DUF4832 domain-containing protein [Planctomycetota bacterium]|nr:DUF4832 domain-containing protein [Planctomycetota bacterium]
MPEIYRKARPRELKTPLLTNPHKGCATFQGFTGDALFPGEWWSEEGPLAFPAAEFDVAPHYLPSSVAYCRWFWEKLEPREGEFDFSMIDGALKTARERHQTLQVRLMGHGVETQPRLPVWYREKYPTRKHTSDQWTYLEADHDSPEYLAKWGRLVQEFGKRYDGHPGLESVDIAFIGRWGEGLGECTEATSEKFLDLYQQALTKTPLLINCEGVSFKQGIARGLGWRADAFGDLRRNSTPEVPPHLGWNHTYDMYPRWVSVFGAADIWKTRSVTLETYSAPMEMLRHNYDLELVLQQGLKYHASIFCPKSTPLPDEWKPRLAEFCDRLGYRFVLRQARWEATATRGGEWEYHVWIENTGVAPLYRRYLPAFRIQTDRGESLYQLESDPRTWLPGDVWLEGKLRILPDTGTGKALVSFGLLDPQTLKPAVRFAVEETDKDGWVTLDVMALV